MCAGVSHVLLQVKEKAVNIQFPALHVGKGKGL
jgi:hypothetical protein